MSLLIKFLEPGKRIEGKELRSKLLHPESELYAWLKISRGAISDVLPNVSPQRMDFHIELIRKDEEPTEEILVSRAQELEGKTTNILTARLQGKTYVVPCPEVTGYGPTHITVVHFSVPIA